ncbi:hypothetical protein [Oceanospirillum linum]|uniref:Uncharacterized protein n=1 Tax=Oceanospirillum linum TaxID=966 RepID=A0A1T1HD56_OCELI|nr:hypothetical protein [Oceanospirillum linum]OOV87789.1 hypothetical protein BTA35_0207235 [Oceanospirillum linum]SEG12257.1 hypothetical protein SAMN04489856_105121 [Oleiphilus messinensis]SMP09514.1 hypothetical protein SAMN06264348_102121 [Oceanospirillum linum]
MRQWIVLFLMALMVTELHAEDLEQKLDALCLRVERCAWQQLDADNLPVENQRELKARLKTVCDSIHRDTVLTQESQFKYRIEACVESMLAQSCDELILTPSPTQACQQLAEESANR